MTEQNDDSSWVMRESEEGLLFLHWPMAVESLRPLVPSGLALDTYDGQAWLTLNAFNMAVAQFRNLPPLPGLNTSPEVDLRTYVCVDGQPGMFFISMDIDNQLGVWISRTFYHLPYLQSRIEFGFLGDGFRLESQRPATKAAPAAVFCARYGPAGDPFCARPGSLEYFLLERHAYFTASPRGRPYRGQDHRLPLVLLPAEAEIEANTIVRAAGLTLPGRPSLLHYSPGMAILTDDVKPLDGLAEVEGEWGVSGYDARRLLLNASTHRAVVNSSEP
jgi:uncharacterized protein YqjF (DUF2071 family)